MKPLKRALITTVVVAVYLWMLWLYIDTHADRIVAFTEGAHDLPKEGAL